MTFEKASDINEQAPYDVIILPGGARGSETLRRSPAVGSILKRQEQNGGWIAAIGGGALSLRSHGIAIGKCLTTHRRIQDDLRDGGLHNVCNLRVCVDGNIITSQGPGTAFEFALTVVEKLVGPDGISDLRDDLALLNWG
ncbi:hypothetical protein RvY_15964-3 [Ramazzottius varieornatus]|uniref:DJ-1/PfpI domain-containing protein n=1 Tax=Ramazzottius varieornatus TaxID=947166 RepID=A0A1D1VWS6_RAMVA|nr:hypothetical protein RvY_15964-3 [Ramazzottius varieornatus]